jgi:hypothetical protein
MFNERITKSHRGMCLFDSDVQILTVLQAVLQAVLRAVLGVIGDLVLELVLMMLVAGKTLKDANI